MEMEVGRGDLNMRRRWGGGEGERGFVLGMGFGDWKEDDGERKGRVEKLEMFGWNE
jgi:hypothetical protein